MQKGPKTCRFTLLNLLPLPSKGRAQAHSLAKLVRRRGVQLTDWVQ